MYTVEQLVNEINNTCDDTGMHIKGSAKVVSPTQFEFAYPAPVIGGVCIMCVTLHPEHDMVTLHDVGFGGEGYDQPVHSFLSELVHIA